MTRFRVDEGLSVMEQTGRPGVTSGRRVTVDAASAEAEDDFALDQFVRDHYPRLIRLAALICGRPSDAEDAVQAGLERAWRQRRTLRDKDRLRPWLDRIVVREALRGVRRRAALPTLLGGSDVTDLELAGEQRDVATDWTAMRTEFERLSSGHRAVISLHLYAGYSVPETAGVLGIPAETVRSRLRVAKQTLRTQLGEDG
jgi:RNA polymerase sigma-70 factor, ECF subfamily